MKTMEDQKNTWIQRNWLLLLLSIIPFILGFWFWDQLPDEIPSHWNEKGEIDDYAGKWTVFIAPLANLFTIILVFSLLRIDPKGNYKQYEHVAERLMLFFSMFFLVVFGLILFTGLGYEINATQVIYVSVLFLFAMIGNYLGKIRPNYFMGIRTPWTLESEHVWNKTHRFAGKLWVFASAFMIIPAFLLSSEQAVIGLVIYSIAIAIVPIVYSYIVFRKEKEENLSPEDSNQ